MLRIAVLTCLGLWSTWTNSSRAATPIEGSWEGAYVRDGAIQMTRVWFQFADDNSITGKYEIPELGLYEQPLENIRLNDTTVQFRTIYGLQTLYFHTDVSQLAGGSSEWTPPLKMHLKRTFANDSTWHTTKDLSLSGVAGRIEGTLYLPTTEGPFPTVVVVHSDEQQTRRDWTYRSWAYLLVKNGIAAFIYDKRGFGGSSGNFDSANCASLATDIESIVEELRTDTNVVAGKIGLLSVSQGGWPTAKAARKLPDIAFTVFFEGPSFSVWEQEAQRVEYSLRADGFSPFQIDSAVTFTRYYFDALAGKKSFNDLLDISRKVQTSRWWGYVQHPRSSKDPEIARWRANNYDPADDLSHLRCPVLAVYGDLDPVVPPALNASHMERLLRMAGVAREFITIPHLRNSIVTSAELSGSTWNWPNGYWIWSYRPHEIEERIPKWILKQTK